MVRVVYANQAVQIRVVKSYKVNMRNNTSRFVKSSAIKYKYKCNIHVLVLLINSY